MNKNLLRYKMALLGDTCKALGAFLGLSPSSFSAKLNGWRGAEFTQNEIRKIRDRYSLTAEETVEIFFINKKSY